MAYRSSQIAVTAAAALFAGLTLAACGGGGGGGGGSPPPPPPPPPAGAPPPVWTQGSFQPASQFKDRCEVVRTGVDIEGNSFPDQPGTALVERFWLRSWTNETYLWNTEVVDRNPAGFSDRRSYFAVLRTTALTPSGKEKDDFHFSEPTTEFLERRNSAPVATYGANFAILAPSPPRDVRVRYTEPGSPAATEDAGQPRLVRGSRILSVNGIDVVNGGATQAEIDAINRALFPPVPGETNSFVVRDPGAASDRTFSMTSVNLAPRPVNRTRIISTPSGNVGYILMNTFGPRASEQDAREAMLEMQAASVQDLVLDFRYNGGGLLAIASQLSYMAAGPSQTTGRAFERLRFNAASGNRNPVTGETNNAIPFYSTGLGFTVPNGTSLPALGLPRVFVLSTDRTCSASEAVVNGLRGIGVEVVLIGTTTCGKPFGFYPTDNCGETYYTIQFQGTNDVGFGDYADGFIPNNSSASFGVRLAGCEVADDLSRELGDPAEALLAAALAFRSSGACPAPPVAETRPSRVTLSGAPALREPAPSILDVNRDMRMPDEFRNGAP